MAAPIAMIASHLRVDVLGRHHARAERKEGVETLGAQPLPAVWPLELPAAPAYCAAYRMELTGTVKCGDVHCLAVFNLEELYVAK